MISVFRLITWLLAVSSTAFAQIFTTTFTWAEGDTVIISQSTDALGNTLAIQTLYVPPFSFCVDERDLMSDMFASFPSFRNLLFASSSIFYHKGRPSLPDALVP